MKNKQEPKAFVYKGCFHIGCRKSTDGHYFFLQTPCLFVTLRCHREDNQFKTLKETTK